MTNFEKFKKDLTIDKLVEIVRSNKCSECPIFYSCDENDGRTCEEFLTQYYEEEVESEVE